MLNPDSGGAMLMVFPLIYFEVGIGQLTVQTGINPLSPVSHNKISCNWSSVWGNFNGILSATPIGAWA